MVSRVIAAGRWKRLVFSIAAWLITLFLLLLLSVQMAHAGGPRWVAGSSYFNSSVKGQPVVWANGKVKYYTDLGALSGQVNQSQANAMVATAAAVWNGVNTAAVSIQRGGSLAEDVNGSNVVAGASGVSMPADIQPGATGIPIAVVYDQDGAVIDAIYGAGASTPLACQNNGVLSTVDNFAVTGNIAHALILVNGLCASTTSQIAMIQYQLIRAFGHVLGLDWSQTNEEMFANDEPTTTGLQGWPIMHPIERLCNGGGGQCIPNPTQLRTDDVAALNRLYPVTSSNIGSFSGKTLTAAATISVQGRIQFATGQGMQGVNVVLQPLLNGVPEIRYTATAVSGVFFQGNAGNRVTGTQDASGNPLNRFGSDDGTLEGYFDLSGVPLPAGVTAAQYQLTFEALNPLYTNGSSVGPYATGQTTPSGTMPVIALGTLNAGSAVTQTVIIPDAADEMQSGPDGSESAPANVPGAGEWTGRITGYGHSGWFQFWARGAREFTLEAQALDANGATTLNKAQVVVGVWNGSDAPGVAPVTATVQPFNGDVPGFTTLPVLTVADSEVRIGLADFRGDGRPDYAYRGRILYADTVTPARLPANGGQIVIRGMGFRPGMMVAVNNVRAQVVSVTPSTIVAEAPASSGVTGEVLVEVQDPATLGVANMAGALSYDAQGSDAVSILTAPMGTAPIGVPEPFTVRAIDTVSQNPAAGVTVTFAVTEGAAALGCGQNTCSVVTAGDGTAILSITATTSSLTQITAGLANGSQVIAEFSGTTPASIAALTPNLYIAMGAMAQWPVQALVLNPAGTPAAGQSVTWSSSAVGLSVAASQNTTAATGTAVNQIVAGPFSASVAALVNACIGGTGNCATFTVTAVHASSATLAAWSGTSQYISAGQAFAPVVLRVTDQFGHPLAGATVTFAETFEGWTEPCPAHGRCPTPPVLAQQMVQAVSGLDGTVVLTPLTASGQAGRLLVMATTGGTATLNFELDAHP